MTEPTLYARLEMRVRDAEKQIDRFVQKADGGLKKFERNAAQTARRVDTALVGAFKNFGKGLIGGAAAALAPLALVQTALDAINKASELVDTADRIGITTTALQELSFGFSQAGVEAGEFESGMDQFTKRIGEAATSGNRLAEILKANGVALRDSNGEIRSSESLLADYADLMKNAASEQERMVLATEAFGRGGAGFTVALKEGAEGIDNMKRAAAEAGGVIDEQLLRRAEEMGDRWDAAWRRFSVNAQSAILTALEGMDELGRRFQEFQKDRNAVEGGAFAGSLAGTKPSGKGDRLNSIDARLDAAFLGEIVKADDALVEALRQRYAAAAKQTIIPGEKESAASNSGRKDAFRGDRDAFADLIGYTREYRREQELANQRLEQFSDIASDAGAALASAFEDGKVTADELLNIVGRIATQLLQMGGGFGGIGGVGGGFLSGIFGALFHKGGVVGSGGPGRFVSPSVFAGAPRMHSGGVAGLRSGEVPAILQKGEVVIPKNFVGRSSQQPQAVTITLVGEEGELFTPRVTQISGKTAGVVVRESRPQLSRDAVSSVQAASRSRPGLFR